MQPPFPYNLSILYMHKIFRWSVEKSENSSFTYIPLYGLGCCWAGTRYPVQTGLCKRKHNFVASSTTLSPILLPLCIVALSYSLQEESREPETYAICSTGGIMHSRRIHLHKNITLRLLWVVLTRHFAGLQKFCCHSIKSSRLRE